MTRRPVCRMTAARAVAGMKALWGDRDGSALVEATIVTPLLVSLFLGVLEFSWYFYNQQLVVAGLRDAARYMARIELTSGNNDPCAQKDQNGVLYTVEAANIATTAQPAAGGAARVGGWKAGDVIISCLPSAALDNSAYADGSTSMTIIDAATSFADPSFGLFSILGLKAPLLSFSHQERFIGAG
jgi:Flp pilus assembly protein TadG